MAVIYNQSGYTYNQSGTVYNQTTATSQSLAVGCHITATSTQTLQIQGRLSKKSTQNFTCQARISTKSTPTFSCQARINRRQQIQIGSFVGNEARITIQSRISRRGGCFRLSYNQSGYVYNALGVTYTNSTCPNGSIQIGCRINRGGSQTITCQANIHQASRLLISCKIAPPAKLQIQARISVAHSLPFGIPAIIYIQARIFHLQRITIGAFIPIHMQVGCRVAKRDSQTIGIGARAISTLQQMTMRALIGKGKLFIQARISRQQGFPVIDPSNPAFPLFQPTQLIMKANIKNTIGRNAQLFSISARISPKHRVSVQMGTRIGRGGQITIQANVQPRFKSTILTSTFAVQSQVQTILHAIFYVEGNLTPQVLGIGAKISRLVTKRITGHFTIPGTPGSTVNVITAGASNSSRAIVGIGAFIS